MPDKKCSFCSPYVDKVTFAESKNFRALYNRAPILPGHVLIIPKNHIQGFLEIEEYLLAEMVSFSRQVIKVLCLEFKTDSFDWTIQDGKPAGQTVEHMHIHIIPRHIGDLPQPGDWYPEMVKRFPEIIDSIKRPKLNDIEMNNIINHLEKSFKALK